MHDLPLSCQLQRLQHCLIIAIDAAHAREEKNFHRASRPSTFFSFASCRTAYLEFYWIPDLTADASNAPHSSRPAAVFPKPGFFRQTRLLSPSRTMQSQKPHDSPSSPRPAFGRLPSNGVLTFASIWQLPGPELRGLRGWPKRASLPGLFSLPGCHCFFGSITLFYCCAAHAPQPLCASLICSTPFW